MVVSIRGTEKYYYHYYHCYYHYYYYYYNYYYYYYSGLPLSGKSQGKTKTFQGQGKVRENI